MSAGRNANWSHGNCRRQRLPQLAHVVRGRAVVRLQGHQDVGIARSDRCRRAVGEIDAAVGQADVVDDRCRSRCGGMTCADRRPRPASQSAAVSSMRVPVRARRCSLIWPASTLGKKSWPSRAASRRKAEDREAAMAAGTAQRSAAAAPAPLEQRVIARRASARSRARSRAGSAAAGARVAACGLRHRAPAASTSPASAPASATARRRPASRTPPPRPAARTGTWRRRSA